MVDSGDHTLDAFDLAAGKPVGVTMSDPPADEPRRWPPTGPEIMRIRMDCDEQRIRALEHAVRDLQLEINELRLQISDRDY